MTINTLLIVLPALTFGAVLVWAIADKWRTERLRADEDAPKSSLASDG